jgi:sugar lactone lactonase YvrE
MWVAISLLSTSVALTSCCLQISGLDEHGAPSGGGTTGGTSTTIGHPTSCRSVAGQPGSIATLAGGGDGGTPDSGVVPAAQVEFGGLQGVAVDATGDIYVSQTGSYEIDKIDCANELSVLGQPTQVVGVAGVSGFAGLAADNAGGVYVADPWLNRIRRIDPRGLVTTVAGNGLAGWVDGAGGDGGSAEFNQPYGIAIDSDHLLFVADSRNNRIRKIDPSGNVTTLAGNGLTGFTDGTGGAQGTAEFSGPLSLAVDGSGNLYVADVGNQSIRRVDPAGNVTTVAGHPRSPAIDADGTGGPTGTAGFMAPTGVAVDASGNIFVADTYDNRVRRIDSHGNVTTLAGNGEQGDVNGTLGRSGSAEFWKPFEIAADADGHVYVADFGNQRIRVITP